MNKSLRRIVSLLLVPCLLGDPAMASGLVCAFCVPSTVHTLPPDILATQALAALPRWVHAQFSWRTAPGLGRLFSDTHVAQPIPQHTPALLDHLLPLLFRLDFFDWRPSEPAGAALLRLLEHTHHQAVPLHEFYPGPTSTGPYRRPTRYAEALRTTIERVNSDPRLSQTNKILNPAHVHIIPESTNNPLAHLPWHTLVFVHGQNIFIHESFLNWLHNHSDSDRFLDDLTAVLGHENAERTVGAILGVNHEEAQHLFPRTRVLEEELQRSIWGLAQRGQTALGPVESQSSNDMPITLDAKTLQVVNKADVAVLEKLGVKYASRQVILWAQSEGPIKTPIEARMQFAKAIRLFGLSNRPTGSAIRVWLWLKKRVAFAEPAALETADEQAPSPTAARWENPVEVTRTQIRAALPAKVGVVSLYQIVAELKLSRDVADRCGWTTLVQQENAERAKEQIQPLFLTVDQGIEYLLKLESIPGPHEAARMIRTTPETLNKHTYGLKRAEEMARRSAGATGPFLPRQPLSRAPSVPDSDLPQNRLKLEMLVARAHQGALQTLSRVRAQFEAVQYRLGEIRLTIQQAVRMQLATNRDHLNNLTTRRAQIIRAQLVERRLRLAALIARLVHSRAASADRDASRPSNNSEVIIRNALASMTGIVGAPKISAATGFSTRTIYNNPWKDFVEQENAERALEGVQPLFFVLEKGMNYLLTLEPIPTIEEAEERLEIKFAKSSQEKYEKRARTVQKHRFSGVVLPGLPWPPLARAGPKSVKPDRKPTPEQPAPEHIDDDLPILPDPEPITAETIQGNVQKLVRATPFLVARAMHPLTVSQPALGEILTTVLQEQIQSAILNDEFPKVDVTVHIHPTGLPLGSRLGDDWKPVLENLVINALRAAAGNSQPAIHIEIGNAFTRNRQWQDYIRISGIGQGRYIDLPIFPLRKPSVIYGTGHDLAEAQGIVSQYAGASLAEEAGPGKTFAVRFHSEQPEGIETPTGSKIHPDNPEENLDQSRDFEDLLGGEDSMNPGWVIAAMGIAATLAAVGIGYFLAYPIHPAVTQQSLLSVGSRLAAQELEVTGPMTEFNFWATLRSMDPMTLIFDLAAVVLLYFVLMRLHRYQNQTSTQRRLPRDIAEAWRPLFRTFSDHWWPVLGGTVGLFWLGFWPAFTLGILDIYSGVPSTVTLLIALVCLPISWWLHAWIRTWPMDSRRTYGSRIMAFWLGLMTGMPTGLLVGAAFWILPGLLALNIAATTQDVSGSEPAIPEVTFTAETEFLRGQAEPLLQQSGLAKHYTLAVGNQTDVQEQENEFKIILGADAVERGRENALAELNVIIDRMKDALPWPEPVPGPREKLLPYLNPALAAVSKGLNQIAKSNRSGAYKKALSHLMQRIDNIPGKFPGLHLEDEDTGEAIESHIYKDTSEGLITAAAQNAPGKIRWTLSFWITVTEALVAILNTGGRKALSLFFALDARSLKLYAFPIRGRSQFAYNGRETSFLDIHDPEALLIPKNAGNNVHGRYSLIDSRRLDGAALADLYALRVHAEQEKGPAYKRFTTLSDDRFIDIMRFGARKRAWVWFTETEPPRTATNSEVIHWMLNPEGWRHPVIENVEQTLQLHDLSYARSRNEIMDITVEARTQLEFLLRAPSPLLQQAGLLHMIQASRAEATTPAKVVSHAVLGASFNYLYPDLATQSSMDMDALTTELAMIYPQVLWQRLSLIRDLKKPAPGKPTRPVLLTSCLIAIGMTARWLAAFTVSGVRYQKTLLRAA